MIIKFLSRIAKNATPSFRWGMAGTSVALIVLFGLGIWLAPAQGALTLIIGGSGYVVGQLIGIFLSPHKGEGGLFRAIGSYVVTFISGYLASKLAGIDFLQMIKTSFSNSLTGGRLLLCISFFMIGLMQAYFVRVYLDPKRPQDDLVQ
jgi:hypothetical protein